MYFAEIFQIYFAEIYMLHVNTGRHYDTSLASHIGSFYTSGQLSPDTLGYAGGPVYKFINNFRTSCISNKY